MCWAFEPYRDDRLPLGRASALAYSRLHAPHPEPEIHVTVSSGDSDLAPETTSLADGLAFSFWLPAAVAASLILAIGRLLAAAELGRIAALAAAGTFVVYAVDRLRDRDRDRQTSPRRTAFLERNLTAFRVALASAGLVLAITALGSSMESLALCAALGGLGLLHRRLKHVPALKSVYVSIAWTGVCVGLPWLAAPEATSTEALALVAVLYPTFWANLVASNLRDDEAAAPPLRALALARGALVFAIAACAFAPPALRLLAWVPVFELATLLRFRATEHYGHLAVDGALFVGALATLAHHALA